MKTVKFLFIGLGNRDVTPDAVGPLTMDRLQIIVPEYYSEDGSEVFVYAPGVTIQTGLGNSGFCKSYCNGNKARSYSSLSMHLPREISSRLCRTIQLTDTGIHPGSGVGNSRKEISEEVLESL